MGNSSWALANAEARACHVMLLGPKLMPGTCPRSFDPRSAVVDFVATPGGATRTMKKFGYQ